MTADPESYVTNIGNKIGKLLITPNYKRKKSVLYVEVICECGVKKYTVWWNLIKKIKPVQSCGCGMNKNIYLINHHVFDTITEETAYWIGFLMADGNVTKNRNNININLKFSDFSHLEKLELFLGITGKIKTYNYSNYKSCKLDFNSLNIKNKLIDYGVTPNKSLTSRVTDCLVYNKHFWRGVIDGDGSIGKYYNNSIWCIKLVGSEFLTYQFLEFIKVLIETKCSNFRDKTGNYWHLGIKNISAEKLIHHLYKDSSIFLDRKKEIADRCIVDYENRH